MKIAIDSLLPEIERAIPCDHVRGDILPLPPNSLPDRKSLVVNCFFEADKLASAGSALLVQCRKATCEALKTIANYIQKQPLEFDIVGVSIFKMAASGQNIRVYWANSRKDRLSNLDNAISLEGSHVDELSALLEGTNNADTAADDANESRAKGDAAH